MTWERPSRRTVLEAVAAVALLIAFVLIFLTLGMMLNLAFHWTPCTIWNPTAGG